MAEDWGYSKRKSLYADLTLIEWCEMLEGEDPDDRAIREAHGIGYREPHTADVKCRNGCGLSYVELSAGKVRECEAVSDDPQPGLPAIPCRECGKGWGHYGWCRVWQGDLMDEADWQAEQLAKGGRDDG